MSDSEEYEYEYDSDEQYQSEEEDQMKAAASCVSDEESSKAERNALRDARIELENTFYEAEDFKQRGQFETAKTFFEKVISLEQKENIKWSFQAYENIVKICASTKKWEEMIQNYQQMLTFLENVTRNESTDSISSILDTVSSSCSDTKDKQSSIYTSKMYEITLEKLKNVHNDRLWFSMNLKLGRLYLELQEFSILRKLLDQLYHYCETPEGTKDESKATALLDIYCLDIQLCSLMKNTARLKILYPKTINLDGAIFDPRVMGLIREEGGKMYMEEQRWMDAYHEFFEGFRNYQEAGNTRATACLKYVVLANMLASSDINPFDSREAKVYKDVDEVNAMLLLRSAYEANDIGQFEKILRNPKYKLLADPIMKRYLDPLLRNIRSHVLQEMVGPYRTIQLDRIAQAMSVSRQEVEDLAVELITDAVLIAKIDQINGILVRENQQNDTSTYSYKPRDTQRICEALNKWTFAIDRVHRQVVSCLATAPMNTSFFTES